VTSGPAGDPTTTAGTRITAAVAVLLGLAESGLAGWAWVDTATSTSESSTAALGYVVALLLGVPGVLALVLGALGLGFARRAGGLPLAILGVVVAAGPVVLWLSAWLPWL